MRLQHAPRCSEQAADVIGRVVGAGVGAPGRDRAIGRKSGRETQASGWTDTSPFASGEHDADLAERRAVA